jgi:predicted nucleic acid-binding protein
MDKPSDRFFLDTGYVIARFNRRDQYHQKAKELTGLVAARRELWTTDAVLLEVAAAFSSPSHRSHYRCGMSFMAAIHAIECAKLPESAWIKP